MSRTTLDGRARELLDQPVFAYAGTLGADGGPRVVPVWVDVQEDTIVLNTDVRRAWARNLERDPRITLLVPDPEDPYDFVSVRGRVVERTRDGADAHMDTMARKYLNMDVHPEHQPDDQRVLLRIQPEHVFVRSES